MRGRFILKQGRLRHVVAKLWEIIVKMYVLTLTVKKERDIKEEKIMDGQTDEIAKPLYI